MTLAPFVLAKSRPWDVQIVVPAPLFARTLTGRIDARGATPTQPVPFIAAAAMPVTRVPWPLSSAGLASWLTKSDPARMRPADLGCARSRPVSRIAILTPAPPVDERQREGRRVRSGP